MNMLRTGRTDYLLVIAAAGLLAAGLWVQISIAGHLSSGNILGVSVGLALLVFFVLYDYSLLLDVRYAVLAASIVPLIACCFFRPETQTACWLPLTATVGVVLFLASEWYLQRRSMNRWKAVLWPELVVPLAWLLLLVQSDSIGMLCLSCAAIVIVCLAGARGWILGICLATAAAAGGTALAKGVHPAAAAAEGSGMSAPVFLYVAFVLIIVCQAVRVAVAARDLYGRLVAAGLAAMAGCQLAVQLLAVSSGSPLAQGWDAYIDSSSGPLLATAGVLMNVSKKAMWGHRSRCKKVVERESSGAA